MIEEFSDYWRVKAVSKRLRLVVSIGISKRTSWKLKDADGFEYSHAVALYRVNGPGFVGHSLVFFLLLISVVKGTK